MLIMSRVISLWQILEDGQEVVYVFEKSSRNLLYRFLVVFEHSWDPVQQVRKAFSEGLIL